MKKPRSALFITLRIAAVFILGYVGMTLTSVGQEITGYSMFGWTITAFTYLFFGISLAKDADR